MDLIYTDKYSNFKVLINKYRIQNENDIHLSRQSLKLVIKLIKNKK